MKKVVVIDTCTIINLMHIERFSLLEDMKYSSLTTLLVQIEFDEGHNDSREYFYSLTQRNRIQLIPLKIGDLIMMANVPKSKRCSDAELSCFVIAQRIGCQTMTDDKRAVKFLNNHFDVDSNDVIGLVDLLFEAYYAFRVNDSDLRAIQEVLENNRFHVKFDLSTEAARRRLMVLQGENSAAS
jgi:predicted nucleic acid-binding protein